MTGPAEQDDSTVEFDPVTEEPDWGQPLLFPLDVDAADSRPRLSP